MSFRVGISAPGVLVERVVVHPDVVHAQHGIVLVVAGQRRPPRSKRSAPRAIHCDCSQVWAVVDLGGRRVGREQAGAVKEERVATPLARSVRCYRWLRRQDLPRRPSLPTEELDGLVLRQACAVPADGDQPARGCSRTPQNTTHRVHPCPRCAVPDVPG